VRAEASRGRSTSQTQQEILVISGGKAQITVAEQVPYTDWFWTWGQSQGLWAPAVEWRDVGATLVVEPVALGDGRIGRGSPMAGAPLGNLPIGRH